MINLTLDKLVEYARSAEKNNPLDWGEFLVREDVLYKTIALNVYNVYSKIDPENKELLLLAALINLNLQVFLAKLHNNELLASIDKLQKEPK